MMKDVNEDDLKNKEDLHRWKAHGAGHIPLCGIFINAYFQMMKELVLESEFSTSLGGGWVCLISQD